jgi:hypothetical protein
VGVKLFFAVFGSLAPLREPDALHSFKQEKELGSRKGAQGSQRKNAETADQSVSPDGLRINVSARAGDTEGSNYSNGDPEPDSAIRDSLSRRRHVREGYANRRLTRKFAKAQSDLRLLIMETFSHMTDFSRTAKPDGSPLAVCINDCQLDCGQPAERLAPICFELRCAFAELRWGPEAVALKQKSGVLTQTARVGSMTELKEE